jgi:hypothetical protein
LNIYGRGLLEHRKLKRLRDEHSLLGSQTRAFGCAVLGASGSESFDNPVCTPYLPAADFFFEYSTAWHTSYQMRPIARISMAVSCNRVPAGSALSAQPQTPPRQIPRIVAPPITAIDVCLCTVLCRLMAIRKDSPDDLLLIVCARRSKSSHPARLADRTGGTVYIGRRESLIFALSGDAL